MQEDAWPKGLELFNQAEYWECHEALEPLWLNAQGLDKDFYGGIILLAAALHKARSMHSTRGGRRNFAKALVHLAVIPDEYMSIDVRNLESLVHHALRNPQFFPQIPVLERSNA